MLQKNQSKNFNRRGKKKCNEALETNTIDESAEIGCVEHNQDIVNKIFELTIVYALKIFCENINNLLTGKIQVLPPEPSAIQELARSFWVKKTHRIGKHSDIFNS